MPILPRLWIAPGMMPILHAPGVMTPSEVERGLQLGCRLQKFFPAEAAGGAKMLKALAPDMCSVTTGGYEYGSDHYLPTMQALEAGCHVLGEKPISNEISCAEEMVAKAASCNIPLLAAVSAPIAAPTDYHLGGRSGRRCGRAAGVGPPHDVMRELAPGRELIAMRRAPGRAAIDQFCSPEEIRNAHHDDVLGRARLDGCRPRVPIAQHHHAVIPVGIALVEQLGQFVGKSHVTVGQGGARFPMVMTMHHPRLAVGMIPRAAVLADAVPTRPSVVRRRIEFCASRVLLQLGLDVRQPLLPHRGVRLTDFHGLRARMRATGAVRLQREQFRLRFVEALVPVAEGMPAFALKVTVGSVALSSWGIAYPLPAVFWTASKTSEKGVPAMASVVFSHRRPWTSPMS